METAEWIAAIGVPIALSQLWLVRRDNRSGFEQNFVARYWEISDGAGDEPDGDDVRRYLRLAEDEFELMRLGRISWGTWDIWHDGIHADLARFSVTKDDDRIGHWTRTCLGARSGGQTHSGLGCPALFEANVDNVVAAHRSRTAPVRLALLAQSRLRRLTDSVARRIRPPRTEPVTLASARQRRRT